MRRRSLARRDVPVGVAANEADTRQVGEHFQRLGGLRADRDEVTQRPPLFDAVADPVRYHRLERDPIAVDAGQQAQPHAPRPTGPGGPYPTGNGGPSVMPYSG